FAGRALRIVQPAHSRQRSAPAVPRRCAGPERHPHAGRTADPAARPAQAPGLQPLRPPRGAVMNHRHLIALGLAVAMLAACKPQADEATAPPADTAAPAQRAPAGTADLEPPPGAEAAARPEMPSLRVTTLDGKPYDL